MGVEGHSTGGVQRRTVPIRCVREGEREEERGEGGREREGERGRGRERMKAVTTWTCPYYTFGYGWVGYFTFLFVLIS